MTWPHRGTHLPARVLAKAIYLSGIKPSGYWVILSGYDGCLNFLVPSTRVGNAIVKTLRILASERPDLFSPTQLQQAFQRAVPCKWDGGHAVGCAIERAFGDGNDIGG